MFSSSYLLGLHRSIRVGLLNKHSMKGSAMQRRLLVTAISLGLLAATTTVLAETSPLEQQLKELPSFQVIAHRGAGEQYGSAGAGP